MFANTQRRELNLAEFDKKKSACPHTAMGASRDRRVGEFMLSQQSSGRQFSRTNESCRRVPRSIAAIRSISFNHLDRRPTLQRIARILLSKDTLSTAVFISILSCAGEPVPDAVDTSSYAKSVASVDTIKAEQTGRPHIRFTDITASSGIHFIHQTGAFGEKWMPESLASGCVIFDYNQDRLQDVLFLNGTFWPGHEGEGAVPTPRLYHNKGGMRFEDVTEQAGLNVAIYGMGGTAGDYDGDGDPDLYLTSVGDNLLLRNDGGRFVDVTMNAGVGGGAWKTDDGKAKPEWSTSAAWVDVDSDGWIDLFVGNYVQWSPETDLFASIDGENKSYATPQEYRGLSARLYHNLGNGQFEDVTEASGVYNPDGKTMGVAVSDYDSDGDTDIFVTNDTQPNFLYKNAGDGTFEDVALTAGVAYDEVGRARAGMGLDVASVDASGNIGIAIGNFSRESLSLYVQANEDLFIDFAGKKRLATPTLLPLTFGVAFVDVDLDGYADIVCVNGHLEPEINRVQKEITYRQRPQLFWNDGTTEFLDVTEDAGSGFERAIVGRGLAYGDLDNDGDIDLVMVENGGVPILARNESKGSNAIRILLFGDAPNTMALNAKVRVVAGDRSNTQMVRTGSSYMSQSETVLTFGLGAATMADSVIVNWNLSEPKVLESIQGGRTIVISESGTVLEEPFVAN